jgi:hypothetical protein
MYTLLSVEGEKSFLPPRCFRILMKDAAANLIFFLSSANVTVVFILVTFSLSGSFFFS